MSKAIPMLYFGLSRILFIEDELSHYENERRAIFCILNLSYLIYDSVSESFQFINTTDLVRVALDFDKTAVNQSISCRTDDPNACFSIFKNCLWGAEFLWINKSIPFMVLRRLMLGITNARLQAVREVLGQFYLRLWILSLMKVDSFHVCCPNYWSVYVEEGEIIVYSKGLFI